MNAWYEVNRNGDRWAIAAANPAQSVIVADNLAYDDAMTLARMVASTLRLDVRTRIEETP